MLCLQVKVDYMKKAFVTGATGFLGLNLIERLLLKEWNITALYLPGDNLKYLSQLPVESVAGNVLDYQSLLKAIPEGHIIFHLAGDTTTWHKNAERQYNINVRGTINMCRAAIEKKASRFVITSSSSAFGCHEDPISEQTVSNALTCKINYHRTKYLSEQEVKKAVEQGLFAVIMNPCNIIGPYDPGNWSQLIKSVYQNDLPGYPPGIGTFAHVRDVADAHISAANNGRKGENYLLGGVEASFKEVIIEILNIIGKDLIFPRNNRHPVKLP